MLEIFAINFNLFFWILTILFALIVVLKYRKDYSKIFNSYLLFFVTFLSTLYWIPEGFDVTDEGLILSKSWFMLNGMWLENIDKIWGTTLINGLWLNILNSPSLLWARIGYVIIISAIAVASFKILIIYFKRNESFVCVIILSIISYIGYPQTINYHNLPILLILISILYFIKGNLFKNKYHFIISGIFIAFGIYSRISVVIFAVFPFLYLTIWYLYLNKSFKSFIKYFTYSYIGQFFGGLLGIILLLITGSIGDYFNNIFQTISAQESVNPTHTLNYLSDLYKKDIWNIFSKSLFVGIILLLVPIFTKKFDKKVFKLLVIIPFVWIGNYYYSTGNSYRWMFILLSTGVTSLLLFVIYTNKYKKYEQIIFFSLLMFFFSFIGSNNGFKIILPSGAAILPLASFIILLKSTDFSFNNQSFKFNTSIVAIFIFIVLIYIDIKPINVYRERPRNELIYQFQNKSLIGIKSNKKRVDVVDSLFTYINNNVLKDETIMVVGTMPILYYLNNKQYHTKDLWRQPENQFVNSFANFPDYFIFPLKNSRDFWWPNGNGTALQENDSLNYKFYLNFVSSNTYKVVYENEMFRIFKKPDYTKINKSLSNGLIAYYPFDGNANDQSENSNHGEIIGAKLTADKNDKKNSAFYFDGKSYIKIKNDSSLNPLKAISISAWYKPENHKGSGSDPIVTKGYSTHNVPYYQYHLSVTGILYNKKDGGRINFTVSPQKKPLTISSPANYIKEEKWYFITGIYNDGNFSLYIDDLLIITKDEIVEGVIEDYGLNLLIGKGNNYDGYIKGVIDEVRIYNRALSNLEVNMLYNK